MSFTQDRLARIAQLEQWHFWFVGRRFLADQLLKNHLPPGSQTILDLGCGTGLTVELLTAQGHQVTGIDLHNHGLKSSHQKLPQLSLIQADAMRLPLKNNCFNVALLLDVMEHVSDKTLLEEVKRVLCTDGILLVMVPANPWLWSYRDSAAGHLRRYTYGSLFKLLEQAKFRVKDIRYYQFWLMPLLIITRLFGRQGPSARDLEERPHPLLNKFLTKINLAEAKLGNHFAWPWGSSLIAVCQKTIT